jgi:transposase
MQILYPRCCGLDVHKASISACILVYKDNAEPEVRRRTFTTFTKDLVRLKMWLTSSKVNQVALESTGVYWKPVWNILEHGSLQLMLINPQHFHAIPGCKTDPKDSRWLAELLSYGLLRPSFVPPQAIRELRDLTRYRVHLKQDRNRIHNRVHKVLEDANIKLDCVATDILGISGRRMIDGIVEGRHSAEFLADRARSRLREKLPSLRLALKGRVTDHHRLMLRELLGDLDTVDSKIERLEQEIVTRVTPYADLIERLCTIPGIDTVTAWTLVAEIGVDMAPFPDADHLASWAGLCPGLKESAGKRMSGRTRKGDCYLRRALCQAAWAVSHTKDNYLAALFYRIAGRQGLKKATIAVAHQLLRIVYHIIRDGGSYRDLGGNYFDQLHPERTRNRLVRRLENLGLEVTLRPRDLGAAPAAQTP